jgi:hypothetical protein
MYGDDCVSLMMSDYVSLMMSDYEFHSLACLAPWQAADVEADFEPENTVISGTRESKILWPVHVPNF